MAAIGTSFGKSFTRTRRQFAEDRTNTTVATLLTVGALAYPVIDRMFDLGTLDAMIPIVIFIVLALGLNIVVGYAGLLDLGYAAFFAIGAYTAAILTSSGSALVSTGLPFQLNLMPATILTFLLIVIAGAALAPVLRRSGISFRSYLWGGLIVAVIVGFLCQRVLDAPSYLIRLPRMNFWFIILFAFFVAAAFGVILGAPTLRLRGDYLAIVTLGFGEIVPVVFRNSEQLTNGEKGLSPVDQPRLFDLAFTSEPSHMWRWWYLIVAIAFLIIFIARRLRDSRLGRAWMAIREDELAASSMGVDLVKTKLLAFALGASFSGVAGVLYASRYSYAGPSQFEFGVSVLLLAMVILGGLGNIWGVIVGGLLLGIFDRILSARIPGWLNSLGDATGIGFLRTLGETNPRYLIFGVTLVLMMLLRPGGLLPNARRRAEIQAATPQGGDMMDESLYGSRGEPV